MCGRIVIGVVILCAAVIAFQLAVFSVTAVADDSDASLKGEEDEALRNPVDIVFIGTGIGYYPKMHLSGMECECLAHSTGRIAIQVDEVLLGEELLGESRAFYKKYSLLEGHGSGEVPELLELCGEKNFCLLKIDDGMSAEELIGLDASCAGEKALWLIRFEDGGKAARENAKLSYVSSDHILPWLFRWSKIPFDDEMINEFKSGKHTIQVSTMLQDGTEALSNPLTFVVE